MENTTLPQRIAIFIAPMISGSLSFLASTIIIVMILRSKTKLSSPHRRMIFGLSCYDMFLSCAQAFSLMPVPPSDTMWGALGNRQTCNAQGVFMLLGITGGPLYNLSLCVFYLCTVVCFMKKSTFVKRVEPFLHVVAVLYSWVTAIYLLVAGYYNPGSDFSVCWIAPYPKGCANDPNVPCERGENSVKYRWVFVAYPMGIIFIFIMITMTLVSWKYYKQQRIVTKYNFEHQTTLTKSGTGSCTSVRNSKSSIDDDVAQKPRKSLLSLSSLRRSSDVSRCSSSIGRRSVTTKHTKDKRVMAQAMLYILAYFMTWFLPYTINIVESRKKVVPYALRLISRIVNPGQGVMNILVYTRPHVISRRKAYPEYSWFKAFVEVIKSGGDNDGHVPRRRSIKSFKTRKIPNVENV